MKTTITRVTGLTLLLLAGTVVALGDTVLSPARRQQALERSKSLLAAREITPLAVNPFSPPAFAEFVAGSSGPAPSSGEGGDTTPQTPTGPRTDHDILQAIAASLKPSGYIVLGGQPSLSFGQKRVKAGGLLTITFEGNQYTLEVTSIDRTNFTLRLNREEFTRTIK